MSVPAIEPNSIGTSPPVEVEAVAPLSSLPRAIDSIQTPPKSSRWSWSYMAMVITMAIAGYAVAAFCMKYILRNQDRAAEYEAQSEYYRDCLAKAL
jgi:hypothetical protein